MLTHHRSCPPLPGPHSEPGAHGLTGLHDKFWAKKRKEKKRAEKARSRSTKLGRGLHSTSSFKNNLVYYIKW